MANLVGELLLGLVRHLADEQFRRLLDKSGTWQDWNISERGRRVFIVVGFLVALAVVLYLQLFYFMPG